MHAGSSPLFLAGHSRWLSVALAVSLFALFLALLVFAGMIGAGTGASAPEGDLIGPFRWTTEEGAG